MARERWAALDDLRGLAILLMIVVNVGADFAGFPSWLKHAPGPGLTVADVVLPVFLFSLGLSASFSFSRRLAEKGRGRTILHAGYRYGILFAFGTVGMLTVDRGASWEVLQMLGATGLFSFFFLFLKPVQRLCAAAAILAAVEVLRPLGFSALIAPWYDSGLAGPWGTFSLGAIAITASAIGEMLRDAQPRRRVGAAGIGGVSLMAAGLLALFLSPFSKHLLSLSYILFTTGIAGAALALLVAATEMGKLRIPLVGCLGRNALLLYMLHAVLGEALHALVPAVVGVLSAWGWTAAVLAACIAVAWVLDRKGIFLRL
jgi:predicted acyltransferase